MHVVVTFPSFVFQFDGLNGHRIGVRVEIRHRQIFRNPTAENLVNDRHLAGFVKDFDDEVLTEVLERYFRAETGTIVPDLVGPLLKIRVVSYAAFQRDRLVLGSSGRFTATAWVATFAMLDNLRGPLEGAALANAGHRAVNALKKDLKLEVLIGVETISTKLSNISSLDLDLTGHLLKLDDYKLRRFEGREADMNVDDTEIDVVLGRGVFVTLNEVGFAW